MKRNSSRVIIFELSAIISIFVMTLTHTEFFIPNYYWLQFIRLRMDSSVKNIEQQREASRILTQIQTLTNDKFTIERLLGFLNVESGNDIEAINHWAEIPNMNVELTQKGDLFWSNGNFKDAAHYYSLALAVSNNDKISNVYFRCTVAAIFSEEGLSSHCLPDKKTIVTLEEDITTIPGNNLKWLDSLPFWNISSGDYLPGDVADPRAGIMWWSGTSIVMVDSPKPQMYELNVRLQNAQSGSLCIVTINNVDVRQFPGIGSIPNEFATRVFLKQGLNIVGIKFPKDIGDLVIHEIQLHRIKKFLQ